MNRSTPPAVVIPELPYPNVREAVDWLCETFGFTERLRIGIHRAQLQFGEGSRVVIQAGNSNPSVSVMVRVASVDAHYERVARAWTKIIHEPADYRHGERQYTADILSNVRRCGSSHLGWLTSTGAGFLTRSLEPRSHRDTEKNLLDTVS